MIQTKELMKIKDKTKTTTQINVDKEIYFEFKKQAYLKGQSLPEALEHAMKLYNDEVRNDFK